MVVYGRQYWKGLSLSEVLCMVADGICTARVSVGGKYCKGPCAES
jgi:hypothetical protein